MIQRSAHKIYKLHKLLNAQSLFFCVAFCTSLFCPFFFFFPIILATVLSVVHRFTLLITTFDILDLRLLITILGILDLRLLITILGILDLRLLITPLVS